MNKYFIKQYIGSLAFFVILWTVVFYIAGSFIEASFDITEWEFGVRKT